MAKAPPLMCPQCGSRLFGNPVCPTCPSSASRLLPASAWTPQLEASAQFCAQWQEGYDAPTLDFWVTAAFAREILRQREEIGKLREDATRWRFIRDGWPDVRLGWLDVEAGMTRTVDGDPMQQYVRTPSVGEDNSEMSWEGDTPEEAVDAARAALTALLEIDEGTVEAIKAYVRSNVELFLMDDEGADKAIAEALKNYLNPILGEEP